MALNMARIYEGFVAMGPSLPGGPEEYFENISLPTFVAKSCLFNAQSLILDAIVVSHPFPVCCQNPRERTSWTRRYTGRMWSGKAYSL